MSSKSPWNAAIIKKDAKKEMRDGRHAKKYIDNGVCIVLMYCVQIQRSSVRRFEITNDQTVQFGNIVKVY